MRKIVLFTFAAGVATALSACPKPQPPVMASLPRPTVKVHGENEVTSEGLTVTLTPITATNIKDYPQVWKSFVWNKTTPNASGGPGETQQVTTTLVFLPLPAFQVRIANNTGHVVRLTTAVFRLENNVGKKWQTFSSTEEIIARNMATISADPGIVYGAPQIVTQTQAAIGGLQLLTRTVELLKGDEWAGYLAFNFGSENYMDIMNNTERFTLRLAEVPVETNDAGQATKTTEFTFVLDKAMDQIAVVCPPGTTNPSWEAGCKSQ